MPGTVCYLVGNRDHCQGTHASLEGSQRWLTGVYQEPGTALPYVLSLPQSALIPWIYVKGTEVKVSVSLFIYPSSTVCLVVRFIVCLICGSLNQGLYYWFLWNMTSICLLWFLSLGHKALCMVDSWKVFVGCVRWELSTEIWLNFFTARRYPRKGLLFKSN